MKQIVFASNNKGKINEVKAILKDYDRSEEHTSELQSH